MTLSPAILFAAPMVGTLRLPAGCVRILEDGRVFSIAGQIVAVGVSPTVFIIRKPRLEVRFTPQLLEQLVGYLVGRGANVFRVAIRFLEVWHRKGGLEATVIFWLRRLLECVRDRRLFVAFPPLTNPRVVLPIAGAAASGTEIWNELIVIFDALRVELPCVHARLLPELWDLIETWEAKWNHLIATAEAGGSIAAEDQPLIIAADRAWASLVQGHLLECGYLIDSETLGRLL